MVGLQDVLILPGFFYVFKLKLRCKVWKIGGEKLENKGINKPNFHLVVEEIAEECGSTGQNASL